MRGRLMAVAAAAALTVAACGGDDDAPESKEEIADELIAAMEEGVEESGGAATVDEACVRDRINGLSDSDADAISDAWNSADPPDDLSADASAALAGLVDCMDIDLGSITMPSMPDLSGITVPSP